MEEYNFEHDAELRRFANYVLMLEHEIMNDLMDDSKVFKVPEFHSFLKKESTRPFAKIIITSLLSNLHSKRALTKSFINDMFGFDKELKK